MASEIATLALQLDTTALRKGAADAGRALGTVAQEARTTEAAVQKIDSAFTKAAQTLKGLAALAGIGLGARELLELADAAQRASARLRLVTESTQQVVAAQRALFEVAQRTRQDLGATTELYVKLAQNTRELGISTQQTLVITEAVNNALRVSGSNGQQAASAILQLGQAFASGRLQGDEFRSISENASVTLDILAKSMGVTRGALKEMGAEGKITAQVLAKAFTENADALAAQASKLPLTIAESFTLLRNSLQQFVGDAERSTGTLATIAGGIKLVADNLSLIADAAIAAGAVYVSRGLAPMAAAGAAFVRTELAQLRAVAEGRAVLLGSAAALEMKARATVDAARQDAVAASATLRKATADREAAVAAREAARAELERLNAAKAARTAQLARQGIELQGESVQAVGQRGFARDDLRRSLDSYRSATLAVAAAETAVTQTSRTLAVATFNAGLSISTLAPASRVAAAGLGLLRGALALVGGPAGLAVLAAFTAISAALSFFSRRSDEAKRKAEETAGALQQQAQAAREADAALKGATASLVERVGGANKLLRAFETGGAAGLAQAERQQRVLQLAGAAFKEYGDKVGKSFADALDDVGAVGDEARRQYGLARDLVQAEGQLATVREGLSKTTQTAAARQDDYLQSLRAQVGEQAALLAAARQGEAASEAATAALERERAVREAGTRVAASQRADAEALAGALYDLKAATDAVAKAEAARRALFAREDAREAGRLRQQLISGGATGKLTPAGSAAIDQSIADGAALLKQLRPAMEASKAREAIAEYLREGLVRGFQSALSDFLQSGLRSFDQFARAAGQLLGRTLSDAVATALAARMAPILDRIVGQLSKAIERLTSGGFGQGLGIALAGATAGYAVGGLTTSRTAGALGGAATGAAAGAALGSVVPVIGTAVGAVVGAVSGLVGGLIGSSKRAREERARQQAAEEAERQRQAQIFAARAENEEALRREIAVLGLSTAGRDAEAEALRRQIGLQEEYARLLNAGVDPALLARYRELRDLEQQRADAARTNERARQRTDFLGGIASGQATLQGRGRDAVVIDATIAAGESSARAAELFAKGVITLDELIAAGNHYNDVAKDTIAAYDRQTAALLADEQARTLSIRGLTFSAQAAEMSARFERELTEARKRGDAAYVKGVQDRQDAEQRAFEESKRRAGEDFGQSLMERIAQQSGDPFKIAQAQVSRTIIENARQLNDAKKLLDDGVISLEQYEAFRDVLGKDIPDAATIATNAIRDLAASMLQSRQSLFSQGAGLLGLDPQAQFAGNFTIAAGNPAIAAIIGNATTPAGITANIAAWVRDNLNPTALLGLTPEQIATRGQIFQGLQPLYQSAQGVLAPPMGAGGGLRIEESVAGPVAGGSVFQGYTLEQASIATGLARTALEVERQQLAELALIRGALAGAATVPAFARATTPGDGGALRLDGTLTVRVTVDGDLTDGQATRLADRLSDRINQNIRRAATRTARAGGDNKVTA